MADSNAHWLTLIMQPFLATVNSQVHHTVFC